MDFDNSVIIINKPPKIISHELTTWVKKITDSKRAGHAGTLDPQVSGVLPIALGKATKLLTYIAPKDKIYVGIIKFKRILNREEIEKLFQKFTGEIEQTPPKQSAVRKVKRKRKVYYIKFLEQSKENPRLVLFETKVDAGTYIRVLCEQIGKLCGGARMEELRRIAVGEITEQQAFTIYDLIDAIWLWKNKNDTSKLEKMLHKPEEFISYPKVFIKESAINSIASGAQIMYPAVKSLENVKKDGLVSIYSENGKFVGVGRASVSSEDFKDLETGLVVKLERVHI
ncbi:RNA-guided pseudouridylation complex pseudouridine synthase subunit Cbf5 [Candidatus Micrarchaeota archaeon]|nr:RNA-guided pseudouridylation complex pseudouridine synthase subunit Cbf5 [Candidatus Micrarchaeota archaeon]